MPLPEPNTAWPPKAWGDIYHKYNEWGAWYAGDTDELSAIYGDVTTDKSAFGFDNRVQNSNGFLGRVARWFWGTPVTRNLTTKLHVPAASDIAATSADLLFAEPPAVRLEDEGNTGTQDRLDELFGPDTTVTLQEAAEVAAALGGVFLRVGWDETVPDRPLLTAVHPDSAIPTFRWGRLTEVTFHQVVARDGGDIWRHLEHHAPGVVQNALFKGTRKNLGMMVPLSESPVTEGMINELADDGISISTGVDGLDVVYVPNVTPTRIWRNNPVGSALGRSDYSGVEPFLDALDEAYTSWRRDIRLAKSRLIVPDSYLETFGRGQGAHFDNDQDVFTPMNMVEDAPNSGITANQFAIRFQEHKETCLDWWEKIVKGAGYSAQTFGLTGEIAMTATETNAKEKKTLLTRGKKTRLWDLALTRVAEIMLQVDAFRFGTPVTPGPVDVEFAPAVTEQMSERAATVQALNDAEAASTETRVRMAHPDWDDDQVRAEVEQISADRPAPPSLVPMDPADMEGPPQDPEEEPEGV